MATTAAAATGRPIERHQLQVNYTPKLLSSTQARRRERIDDLDKPTILFIVIH